MNKADIPFQHRAFTPSTKLKSRFFPQDSNLSSQKKKQGKARNTQDPPPKKNTHKTTPKTHRNFFYPLKFSAPHLQPEKTTRNERRTPNGASGDSRSSRGVRLRSAQAARAARKGKCQRNFSMTITVR